MLPPVKLEVPARTKAIYMTALSLFNDHSEVSVSWTMGTATFGADFVGPSPSHVLGDKVFGQSIITVDGDLPQELLVSMNFNDTLTHQHSISGPFTKKVGPEGIATQVQISGFAASDHKHEKPTTITIVFQGTLHGLVPTTSS
ncbi:hypothetical protein BDZ45DRAFT_680266 [Acephala macrosclerotiorum]|nr:hypothetical protein BDZ45DRAFT_680266 [Acephala macrosclerotiorum]